MGYIKCTGQENRSLSDWFGSQNILFSSPTCPHFIYSISFHINHTFTYILQLPTAYQENNQRHLISVSLSFHICPQDKNCTWPLSHYKVCSEAQWEELSKWGIRGALKRMLGIGPRSFLSGRPVILKSTVSFNLQSCIK